MADKEVTRYLNYIINQIELDESPFLSVQLIEDILDLIRSQKEEIERLTKLIGLDDGHIKNLEEIFNSRTAELQAVKAELEVTKAYIHDQNLEWDLLSYCERNGG